MAKQAEDKVTAELPLDGAKQRGRPRKPGGAMTAAERKRLQRSREAVQIRRVTTDGEVSVSVAAMSDSALIAAAGRWMRLRRPVLLKVAVNEMLRRSKLPA